MKAAAEAGDRAWRADSRTSPNLVLGGSLQQPLRVVGALTQLRVAVGSYGRYEQRKKATGGGPVVSSKTMLAVGLAAATLVVFVVVIAMGGALRAGLAPWPGIGVAVLAIAAFALSRERRSLVVAGLLGASGVVDAAQRPDAQLPAAHDRLGLATRVGRDPVAADPRQRLLLGSVFHHCCCHPGTLHAWIDIR
jgi:hypothetical protein